MGGKNIFYIVIILLLTTNITLSCPVSNCGKCKNPNTPVCTECKETFYIKNGTCNKCSGNCESCVDSSHCKSCNLFFKMNSEKKCEPDLTLVASFAFSTGFILASICCYLSFCIVCTEKNKKKWKENRRIRKKERKEVEDFKRRQRERRRNLLNQDEEDQKDNGNNENTNPHPIFSEENMDSYAQLPDGLNGVSRYGIRIPRPDFYHNNIH